MSDGAGPKTPAEKMRLKPGMTAALIDVPEDVAAVLGIPEGVTVVGGPAGADFLLAAAVTQADAEKRLTELRPHVGEKTVAWIAYPKGAKAAGRDISRDTLWRFVETIGLTLVANVAIDRTWSAVRVRPVE